MHEMRTLPAHFSLIGKGIMLTFPLINWVMIRAGVPMMLPL